MSRTTHRAKCEWLNYHLKRFFRKNPNKTIDKAGLIAQFCVEKCIPRRDAVEITNALILMKALKEDEGMLSRGTSWNENINTNRNRVN